MLRSSALPQTHQTAQTTTQVLECLAMLAHYHGLTVEVQQLVSKLGLEDLPPNDVTYLTIAKEMGFHARMRQPALERLGHVGLPAVAFDQNGSAFILAAVHQNQQGMQYLIHRPDQKQPEKLNEEDFKSCWDGKLLMVTSTASLIGELAKFDFSWFVPAIVKYRKMLLEVLMVSMVLQLFALATPIFFQVVMDKVLLHSAMTTLNVITISLIVITLFDVTLNYLRSYVFTHTSSRIDVELGARMFRHLLALPLEYFQARRVGDSVARVRELENIREFLTGQGMTLVLDFLFSIIFLGVMFYYSEKLTYVVLASIPCYFILALVVTPILRSNLNDKFNKGAENQSFLVESVSSIDTVKSMALETRWVNRWDELLANYVKASLKTAKTGLIANNGVQLISKMVTIAITYLGAGYVIDMEMTVGELIAFNMLASHVSSPIIRMAQMWSDFQQVGISVDRLGDILNTKTEISQSKTILPALKGRIEFDQIRFRYRPEVDDVIRGISLVVQPGQTIGIVGRSGSGKSTLTKIVQRMYIPQHGRVLIDGFDLVLAEPNSLRSQIGVVLQENILFNRSIRANIAVSNPSMNMASVVAAAELSGADEFIKNLPEGYDTIIGEHGVGLSGGQRQRIAIARAIITNPRILIFDEATSALDYESEQIIQTNMNRICQGRTVIIVAHRLSAVRDADCIYVMEKGEIAEKGTHNELITSGGIYSYLNNIQKSR
jgi:ATP-binding cassette, subfamily B, bacterial HlyB/CyaB